MEYIVIGVCIMIVAAIGITVYSSCKIAQEMGANNVEKTEEINSSDDMSKEILIRMEMLPADSITDSNKLVEIKDSKVLAQINNLIPELVQIVNVTNNAVQALHENGEVLYRAILPPGAKLADSRAMENAVRGIYHGTDGIKGHANFMTIEAKKELTIVGNTAAAAMGVASMVVGQYYMTQINAELGEISEGVLKISGFQNDEYRSRVFSLIAHVKKITDYQNEILVNHELRFSKITQLDNLEEECTQLLGQANLALAGYTNKKKSDYEAYEKEVKEAQDWYMYQKSLVEALSKIIDLRYTLHLGTVSREQCNAIFQTYLKQVSDTNVKLADWHHENMKDLNIDTEEKRRRRVGVDGIIHYIPGLIKDDMKFRSIDGSTVNMINTQASQYEKIMHKQDTSELYDESVHLIVKDGKIYYLPEAAVAMK